MNTLNIRIARGHARNITLTNRGALFDQKTTPRNERLVGITISWGDRAGIKLLDPADFALNVGPRWSHRAAPVGRKVSVPHTGSYALGDTGGRIELSRAGDDLMVTVHGAAATEQRLAA